MQATEAETSAARPIAPRWVWWTLLVGAAILVAWGWFLLGFLGEPSAVGRPRTALAVLGGLSIGTALLAAITAGGLLRRARWAPGLAMAAALLMILTGAGAIAGIPALIGLVSNRNAASAGRAQGAHSK